MLISIVIPSLLGYSKLNNQLIDDLNDTTGEQLDIVLCSENQTFAKNVNVGLKKYKGDIVLVLNNDTTPLPGWDKWLEENASNGIVSMTPRADCGWGFGMSREIQERVGLLDENLFNSYEDYDYFIRAACLGYNRILSRTTYMIHEGGHTINSIWGKFEDQTPERITQCKANKEYMEQKWHGMNFEAVPSSYWALNGARLMKEFCGTASR